jgi:phosphoribosylformylglycinamidine synthase
MAMPPPVERLRDLVDQRTVVSPVTLVVTAFGPVTDVRRAVTPELRGGDRELLVIDLGAGKNRLGGSCLAQVFRQLGDVPPDLDDPKRLAAFYTAIQELVSARKLSAYHDRPTAASVITAFRWRSRGRPRLDTSALDANAFAALFSEELGAVIEVATSDAGAIRTKLETVGAKVHAIGRAVTGDHVQISHAGVRVIDTKRTQLRARWSHVTHEMALRRDDPTCAEEERCASRPMLRASPRSSRSNRTKRRRSRRVHARRSRSCESRVSTVRSRWRPRSRAPASTPSTFT